MCQGLKRSRREESCVWKLADNAPVSYACKPAAPVGQQTLQGCGVAAVCNHAAATCLQIRPCTAGARAAVGINTARMQF